ncbi:hypothetical protein L6452_36927 [Arctium lappa]|uniref:Uncharacterized protein n=1 Tax=Arctium lappa TaxID=4217 RepID=A0ACB8Y1J9_ARCLA|nr:hypothetical protein L6452_36927 [Arctium lappa]
MVEERVFDSVENNNRRSGQEEEGTTIKTTTDEKAFNKEANNKESEQNSQRSKRAPVGTRDLQEFIPEYVKEEKPVKECNDCVIDRGKDSKENVVSSNGQTSREVKTRFVEIRQKQDEFSPHQTNGKRWPTEERIAK